MDTAREEIFRFKKVLTKSFALTVLLVVALCAPTAVKAWTTMPVGYVVTVAGNGSYGYSGDEGPATVAGMGYPWGNVGVDSSGNIYIPDGYNNRVRKVDAVTGVITTVAGNGGSGFAGDGGPAADARIDNPTGVVVDGDDNLFIVDLGNSVIRRVDAASGVITTVAGVGNWAGYGGDGGPATSAYLAYPEGLDIDNSGNLFIADQGNSCIRRVDAVTGIITTVAGVCEVYGYSGDGGPATSATLKFPTSVAVDPDGNLFIADYSNHVIRRVDATTGTITTVAGTPGVGGFGGDGGISTSARLKYPTGVAVEESGDIVIADTSNHRVRTVNALTGTIETLAGTGSSGFGGDGGPAANALFDSVVGVTLDGYGNLFITDGNNNRIRRVFLGSANQAPVANAGGNQTVHVGTPVNLDGSASSDPDENYPLTYAWQITSSPSGSVAPLSGPNSVNPSFTADIPGDYTVGLVVNDALGASSTVDEVIISTYNTPPVADAGPDQSVVLIGSTLQLDGTQSWDDDGDGLAYEWAITTRPATSGATLSSTSSATPIFVADVHGDYVASLTVSDPWVSSETDTVIVTFENVRPVADGGGNQDVLAGDAVFLNGSGSTDANGDSLTYSWSFVSRPAGSTATLTGTNTYMTSFTADEAGTYVVSLVVNDGYADSDPSNASVEAISAETAATQALSEASYKVNHQVPGSLKNNNLANALTNKINSALKMIDKGQYAEAIDKLKNDILGKTDGCATGGSPDRNDWITTCGEQDKIYPLIIEAIDYLNSLL